MFHSASVDTWRKVLCYSSVEEGTQLFTSCLLHYPVWKDGNALLLFPTWLPLTQKGVWPSYTWMPLEVLTLHSP